MAFASGSSAMKATQSATSTSDEFPQASAWEKNCPRRMPWVSEKPSAPDWATMPTRRCSGAASKPASKFRGGWKVTAPPLE